MLNSGIASDLRKENIADLRPLSPMQEGMLYHALREPASPAYIEQVWFRIRGPLDVARLEDAWNLLIDRHDALRTVFVPSKAAQPLQMVLKSRRLTLACEDLRHLDKDASQAKLNAYRATDRNTAFDLTRDLLLRVALFALSDLESCMVWTHHHIILDGWSAAILLEELLAIYESGDAAVLPAPASPVRFAEWIGKQDAGEARAWWSTMLAGYSDPASLPTDPFAAGSGDLRVLTMELDGEVTQRLRDCAARAQVTMNTLTQCAWGVMLARSCNRTDVVFGMTVSGRPESIAGAERIVGLFINTVPVRVRFEDADTVSDLLHRVQRQILESQAFQFLPLAEIQDVSEPRTRLMDHLLTFENYPVGERLRSQGGVDAAGLSVFREDSHERTNYPLAIAITAEGRLTFSIRYTDDAYSPAQMERVADVLRAILHSFASDLPIREVNLLTPKAIAEIRSFQGPYVDVPAGLTMVALFEQRALLHPNRPAVGTLTYDQLNARANALARALGSVHGELVALCLSPGVEMIVGMLGILKAGAAYVPVDPTAPESRRNAIFAQTSARVAVATAGFVSPDGVTIIPPDCGTDAINPPASSTPDDLAYVLFTSGSTGEPKGVAIEQRSVVNMILAAIEPMWQSLGEALRVTLIAPPVFDASVQQIFGTLLLGHTLFIPPADVKQDAHRLLDWLEEQRIDVCDGTPSRFSLLVDAGLCERARMPVRHWMIGGEGFPTAVLREYWEKSGRRSVTIANLYGPTECCVNTSCELITADRIDPMATASIGRPFGNQQVYVLDRNLHEVPVLFEGEICIAGVAVGRGYWAQSELTRRCFVEHPLAQASRLYRTGDIGRRLLDGRLEWLGRADGQVKLRGYRIELGDIEHALRAHPGVEHAAAGIIEIGGGRELTAWYVNRTAVDADALREWVRARLPEYMLPAYFVQIDSLPLNASGKLDRKRLPAPALSTAPPERTATPTESAIRAIWEDVLGRSPIGLSQGFFESGGHSLKAMQAVTRIRRDLGVEASLEEFFASPTIEGLAAALAGRDPQRFLHIGPIPAALDYAASHAQRRLWILSQLEGSAAYNMPAAIALAGHLDVAALRAAFSSVVARHEILRTRLVMRDGELRQSISHAPPDDRLPETDLRGEANPEAAARERLVREAWEPFDLSADSPLRLLLLRTAETRWVLFLNLHHAAGDAISIHVLSRDLLAAYLGRPSQPLPIQYRDFAVWSNRASAAERHRHYWHQKLSGEIPALELPADRPRPVQPNYRGGRVDFSISKQKLQALREFAAAQKATLFAALVAGVKALIHRYTTESEIVIGTPISGRPHPDLETQIGCYINTLVLRDTVRGSESFASLLRSVRQTVAEALEHQAYPFDLLVGELPLPRDTSRNPLFDVMVILQPPAAALPDVPGLSVEPLLLDRGASKFDLTWDFIELADGSLQASLEYSSDLFDRDRIERMAGHFETLLESAVAAPAAPLAKLQLMPRRDWEYVTGELNRESLAQSCEAPFDVPTVFERQARSAPDSPAVLYDNMTLTWAELDRKSANVAALLLRAGVRRGDIVGLNVARSEWLAIAELGVMRAGAAFLPFARTTPLARARFIAADSGLSAVISEAGAPDWAAGLPIVDLRSAPDNRIALPAIDPGDTAYLLYTSGSTGTPKGVAVPHRALTAFATNLQGAFGFRPSDTIYASTPATFDISLLELVCAPLSGIAVHIATDEALEDPLRMASEIERSRASVLQFTPSRLTQLLAETGDRFLRHATVMLVGGEAFAATLARRMREYPWIQVWNVYGPTETCIWSTAELIGESIPSIGRPLPGECVYILSPDLEPQPLGVPGEIAIGGSGLALGYHNNPELTNRRFVTVPFAPGGRVYLTGDLGRWNSSGRLECLGRKDNQVKLRGYRIELEEIEHHLRSHAAVESAAVVVREVGGVPELAAYLVARGTLDARDLRAHLADAVPDYMVPAHFVFMSALPLNTSGKLDRAALPAPETSAAGTPQWDPPRDAMEWRVSAIFQDVLGRIPVGRNGHFFELGGQSLKAMQALSRLRRDVAANLRLADLFTAPTVAALAELASAQTASLLPAIPCTPQSVDGYPLSHVQQRLWVLEQMDPEAAAYNMSAAFLIEGSLQVRLLEESVHALVDRHEILRTVFALEAGEPRQFVRDVQPCFGVVDLRTFPDRDARLEALLGGAAREAFDLARGPLFRCTAYLLEDGRAVLGFRMHHIVSDGWSMRVLLGDLLALYRDRLEGNTKPLAPLQVQYRDWAAWQLSALQGGGLQRQRDYWHARLAGPIPGLDLPLDRPRPRLQSFRGAEHRFVCSAGLANGLRGIAREAGASLFMTLLAAVKVLLHRYTGQEDIIVGTPVAGREHPSIEPLVGVFINSLALRDNVEGQLRFRDLLDRVRATVIGALENQSYPFDMLVDELIRERDTSRSAFFDVMVSSGAEDRLDLSAGGLTAHAIPRPSAVSKVDLSFDFTEKEDGAVEVAIEFNRDLFLPARIVRMQTHLESLLRSIAESPDRRIETLDLMQPAEHELVIEGFNQSSAEFDTSATVIDLFEERARLRPQSRATTCEGRSWTYGELNARANRIAARMIEERSIGPDHFVAVYMNRSDWMIAAVLAVGKAGAAYVPIDPAYPAERIALLLEASGCTLLLSEPATAGFESSVENWNVAEISPEPARDPERRHTPRDLCYVIFTSGSTGSPKGVMVEHLSLANMVSHYSRALRITPDDSSSIYSSMAFDTSIAEYWPILCAGASLHFPADEIRESPPALLRWIASTGLTIINMPTSLGELILRSQFPSAMNLRAVLVGGEQLRPLPRREYPFQVVNSYGPTEATVDTSWAWLGIDDYSSPNPPIGRPIQNARLYVLDGRLNPVPVGIPGELYVGGTPVARGYLHQRDLTMQKFVPDPFAADGSRMYSTGDLVRWRDDGQLEYLGRNDTQLKVRGYRIEPAEIEARLLEHPSISAAAVDAVMAGESKELAAWVVIREGAPQPASSEIREFVRAKLPEFLTPSLVVRLDLMPMTPNGKIDRRALASPSMDLPAAAEAVTPRTAVEAAIHSAWRAILGRQDFGVTENFFDLGGHSLKAMQLTVRLLNSLNVAVSLSEIFLAPTVEAQAQLAASKQRAVARQMEPAPESPDYPVSYAQRRLWFTSQMDGDSARYNMPGAYVIDDAINEVALRRAIQALIERHEVLRTRFVVRESEPRQVVDTAVSLQLPVIDLRADPDPDARALDLAQADVQQPFDLERDLLFRCRLLRLAERKYVLLFTLHHIAGDGWSMQLLYEELQEIYSAFAAGLDPGLPALRLQYKDYAWWERETGFAVEESYWLSRMRSLPDPVRLPLDFSAAEVLDLAGASEGTLLSAEVSENLRRVAAQHGTTLSNVVLTVFFIFLNRLTEQQDLALAMSVANRPHRDLETMAGFFVNAVVLREWVDEGKSFESLLQEVTREVASALEHQHYPLDLLIEKLNPPRRGNRQPLFNVVYAFQGFTDVAVRSKRAPSGAGLQITRELAADSRTAKFDLTLFVVDHAGPNQDSVWLSFEYSTELLRAETARQWIETLGRFCQAASMQEEAVQEEQCE